MFRANFWAVGTVTLALLLSFSACSSSRTLEPKTAKKLTAGITLESPSIQIPCGLTRTTLHDSNAIRACRRLVDAGILRCNSKLTDCWVGPRGKHITDEGPAAGLKIIIGYLVTDEVASVATVDEFSAKGTVILRFRPTFEYRQYRPDFLALAAGKDDAPAVSQAENDGVASAVFRRGGSRWWLEDMKVLKRTATAAWKGPQEEAEPPDPIISNLARSASVTVSSEERGPAHQGANAIDGVFVEKLGEEASDWVAGDGQPTPWIRLTWSAPVQAWEVILYDRPNPQDNIRAGRLTFSDGSILEVGQLPNDGTPYRVEFDPKTITWVQFRVTSSVGTAPGLAEIEVYGLKP